LQLSSDMNQPRVVFAWIRLSGRVVVLMICNGLDRNDRRLSLVSLIRSVIFKRNSVLDKLHEQSEHIRR
jgi:hypothetical protein